MRNCLIIIFFTLFGTTLNLLYGQDAETKLIRKYAENSFETGDYEFALENYLKLYENNKDNININFRIGVCYTRTNIDQTGGIPYLRFVVSHNNFPAEAYFYLGRSYMYAYQFTEAVEAFYEYRAMGTNDKLLSNADRMIDMSYTALEYINQPQRVSFVHLDTSINSSMDDYSPFLINEGQQMLVSSNYRYIDELEINISDVYVAQKKKEYWESATFAEGNTYENEQVVGTSSDGDQFFIYANGDYSTHDIFLSEFGRKGIERTEKGYPADKINTQYIEMGACANAEGNIIYFSSNRPGGFGGMDIYKIVRDEEGAWGEVENLGSNINTAYDDNFPNLSKDEKTMYFASKGHMSIGGYDLFRATWSEEKKDFLGVRTLGVPLNTPYDNTTICFEEDGSIGYIGANRKEGEGKLDIYKVFIDPDAQPTIISGTIMVGTKENSQPYSDEYSKVFVTLYDNYENIYARYPVEGNSFFATIPPGEYILDVYLDGAEKHFREKLKLIDSGEQQVEPRTIYVQP